MSDAPTESQPSPAAEERVITYDAATGASIRLNARIVRQFFNDKADDLSAWAFAAFCRAYRLDPFAREAYLVGPRQDKFTIQVAYQVFQKRAEAIPTFKSFRAGVIVRPPENAEDTRNAVNLGLPRGHLVLEGEYVPEGYVLLGGWCTVRRTDREERITATVGLADYQGMTKEGGVNSMWRTKGPTMIRKTAIAHGFRDAFPTDLANMYIPEELQGSPPEDRVAAQQQPPEAPAPPVPTLPPAAQAIADRLGWNRAKAQMFAVTNRDKNEADLVAMLEAIERGEPKPALPPAADLPTVPATLPPVQDMVEASGDDARQMPLFQEEASR